jgi:hypothetical protein
MLNQTKLVAGRVASSLYELRHVAHRSTSSLTTARATPSQSTTCRTRSPTNSSRTARDRPSEVARQSRFVARGAARCALRAPRECQNGPRGRDASGGRCGGRVNQSLMQDIALFSLRLHRMIDNRFDNRIPCEPG